TDFTSGTPANGAETTPSRRTIRMVPPLSVTRKLPSGRKASENGELRRLVMVSTFSAGEGFAGFGASVCLGKAGFGLGGLPVNADCAHRGAKTAVKQVIVASRRTHDISYIMSQIRDIMYDMSCVLRLATITCLTA